MTVHTQTKPRSFDQSDFWHRVGQSMGPRFATALRIGAQSLIKTFDIITITGSAASWAGPYTGMIRIGDFQNNPITGVTTSPITAVKPPVPIAQSIKTKTL